VQDESQLTLQHNTIEGNGKVGLLVSHLAEPRVVGNVITGNQHSGIILQNFAGGEFRKNIISNNGANVQLLNSCNALFEENTIRAGPGGGVLFRNETTCTLRRNMISDNGMANITVPRQPLSPKPETEITARRLLCALRVLRYCALRERERERRERGCAWSAREGVVVERDVVQDGRRRQGARGS